MTPITIYAVGKLRQIFIESATLYEKRLKNLHIIEITASKEKSAPARLQQETKIFQQKMTRKTNGGNFTIALDANGETITSEAFAQLLEQAENNGQSVHFLIGGADGLSEDLLKTSDRKIAFGKNIWPHELVRVMLYV